jgi:hypothetical protein
MLTTTSRGQFLCLFVAPFLPLTEQNIGVKAG